jgi:hypothetical protein
MTQDEIAQAMQDTAGNSWGTESHFQRFAKLVAKKERETCAKLCESLPMQQEIDVRDQCAAAIRARVEQS